TAGHTTPELTRRKVPGGDSEHKSMLIQFLNRLEFDRNYAILHQDKLDFSPSDVPAVNGVVLEFDEVPTAGTSLKVNAFLAQDRTTPVVGLTPFSIRINGTESSAAEVENPDGLYTLTVSSMSSTDEIEVSLGTTQSEITEVTGVLYRTAPLKDTI